MILLLVWLWMMNDMDVFFFMIPEYNIWLYDFSWCRGSKDALFVRTYPNRSKKDRVRRYDFFALSLFTTLHTSFAFVE